jgi:Spy/CpxP family protein refolding chaperone
MELAMSSFATEGSVAGRGRAVAATWCLVGAVAWAGLLGSTAAHAQPAPAPAPDVQVAMGPAPHGDDFGLGLMGGPPGHVEHAVHRLLHGLNTTDAQRAQIHQIVAATASDLRALRAADADLRSQALELFSAPTLDAAKAESLRQRQLASHDQRTKRALAALLDVAKVLTPEQRAALGERLKRRAAMAQAHGGDLHHGMGDVMQLHHAHGWLGKPADAAASAASGPAR